MIYARLLGGLGNQMFQYAAGRALADHLGTDLALDRRALGTGRFVRDDGLGHFANLRVTKPAHLPPAKSESPLRYALWRKFGRKPCFHREGGLGFDSSFFDLPDHTYLHGYWQSERYFGGDHTRLRHELTLTTPLGPENQKMAARIKATAMPVSLHVRRGDYAASGAYAACGPAYYRDAVGAIAKQSGAPLTVFVFSNDPNWARTHLDLGVETVVVDINGEGDGHFDLHLQSLCAHHVIANSTFSWWGAWLNPSPDKIVVAPKDWFAPGQPQNPDICPDRWLRL